MVRNHYCTACNQFVILSSTIMKRIHTVFAQSGVSDKEITSFSSGAIQLSGVLLKVMIICDRRPLSLYHSVNLS